MTSAMLKRYKDEGCPVGDQPLLAWAFHDSVHRTELALSAALRNYPIRPVGWLLWALVFPWGRRAQAPSDRLGHRAAARSEEHTSELQSLMRISYAVFCLKKNTKHSK